MNKKQKICLWIGIAVIVLMGLYPPWIRPRRGDGVIETARPKDRFILTAGMRSTERVDTSQLLIQWFMVAVVSSGLIVTFADKKPKDEHEESRKESSS